MADVVAAVSVSGIIIPEAIAYAGIANLPPQAGIVAALVGLACYGFLGASRFAIVAATSSSAMMVAAATASVAGDDLSAGLWIASGLVLSVGLFFLLASWMKLGDMTDFIAKPVLRGFAFGLAVVIITKQIGGITGVGLLGGNFLKGAWNILAGWRQWNVCGLLIAGVSLAVMISLSRFRRVPVAMVVVVLGILAGALLDLGAYGVGLVGEVDFSLDKPSFPTLTRAQWMNVAELGLTLSLVLYSESYGSIKNSAVRHGDSVLSNRDLMALGVANLISGVFGGMPVGAGYSATATNEASGARTRWAGIAAAAISFTVIMLFLPLLAFIPKPTLAAIVIYAVGHTLNPEVFKPYFRWKKDRLEILVAVAGVILFGIVNGLILAIVISLATLLKRMAESKLAVLGRLGDSHDFVKLSRYPDARPVEGMIIVRPDQPMFFANSERVFSQIRTMITEAGDSVGCVIVSMEESPDIDSTTIEGFDSFFEFAVANGRRVVVTRLKGRVYDALSPIAAQYGSAVELNFLSVDDAVRLCESGTGRC